MAGSPEGRRYEGFVPGRHLIEAYGNGGFRFADMSHRGSILALPSGIKAWPVTEPGGLSEEAFAPVLAEAGEIEILLVGTGIATAALGPTLRFLLQDAGIGIDAMSTGPAVRTYNILLAENRRVAAALIAVP